MNLESIITKEEQEVIDKLIATRLEVEKARVYFRNAEALAGEAAKEFTTLNFRRNRESKIPEIFVAYYDSRPYLISIDIEGGHGHRVDLIGGVLGGNGRK